MNIESAPFETVFQALSDPLRLRIIRLLVVTKEEACSCELANSLLIPEYKLSRHMKTLRQAGLISTEKEGRWVYHRLFTSNPILRSLFKTLQKLPDLENEHANDLMRFNERMKIRENGRCCVGAKV